MKKNKKLLALVCCMALLVGAVGATLAWLTDQTETVSNTFTVGDINITLDEVKVNPYGEFLDENGNVVNEISLADRISEGTNTYKMIPGYTYTKDPTIKVLPKSEACWLFVQVTETGGVVKIGEDTTKFSDFITYSVNTDSDEWTLLEGTTDVYYRQVAATGDEAITFPVLKGNSIKINDTVTKTMLDAVEATVTDEDSQYPNLSFKAYAVQYWKSNNASFSVSDAWKVAQGVPL